MLNDYSRLKQNELCVTLTHVHPQELAFIGPMINQYVIVNDQKTNFDYLSLVFVRADGMLIVSGLDRVQFQLHLWVFFL